MYTTCLNTLKMINYKPFFYIDYWISLNDRTKNINYIKYFSIHSQSLHFIDIFCNLNIFFLLIKRIVITWIIHHCVRYECNLNILKFLYIKVFFCPGIYYLTRVFISQFIFLKIYFDMWNSHLLDLCTTNIYNQSEDAIKAYFHLFTIDEEKRR